MIDDKKIEEATRDYIDKNGYLIKYDEEPCVDIEFAYKDGAKWAINEFLKNLWHPFDEVPTRKSSNILLFFESYSTGTEDDYDEYFDLAYTREGFTQETWKEFVNEGGIPSKWLYIDDLFSKKGGNND